MTPIERCEVIAEAFRIETGFMAPGKDRSMAAGSDDEQETGGRWDAWLHANGSTIRAMCAAFTRVMEPEE